jgi:hypothetical protein
MTTLVDGFSTGDPRCKSCSCRSAPNQCAWSRLMWSPLLLPELIDADAGLTVVRAAYVDLSELQRCHVSIPRASSWGSLMSSCGLSGAKEMMVLTPDQAGWVARPSSHRFARKRRANHRRCYRMDGYLPCSSRGRALSSIGSAAAPGLRSLLTGGGALSARSTRAIVL